jgi:hypothetical protein
MRKVWMLKDLPIARFKTWRISYALSRDEHRALWTLYVMRRVVGGAKSERWKTTERLRLDRTSAVVRHLTKVEGFTLNALEIWPDKSRAPSMEELRDAIDTAFGIPIDAPQGQM